jgi:hypothetical protein
MLRAKYNLNGHPSLKGATKMRVFCPEHKRGFFAPRQSPIKCENRGHLLGELDFEGQGKRPIEIRWQYCCNCEHFCPVDFDEYGLARCAVCTRRSSQLYLCDKCYVLSFESNTPLDMKNFTLSADGVPQPSCPGCLHPASADQHEHDCEALGASFITALTSCPICEERLDIAPAFPSPVAHYLKRTKSAHKTNVTFDYETESFVPVEDGEFVLVNNGDPNIQPIVLPRAPRFATRRDFYEYYQDYYHCQKPDAGEVHILRPAAVNRAGAGWKLQTTGLLEVIADQPKKKPVETPAPQPIVQKRSDEPRIEPRIEAHAHVDEPRMLAEEQRLRIDEQRARAEEPPGPIETKKQEPAVKTCNGCGASIESRYAFCWKCGSALSSQSNGPVVVRSKPLPLPIDDDEMTVQYDQKGKAAGGKSMFSWTMPKPPERPGTSRGSVLKLMAIGGVAFTLLALGMVGLTRSDSPVEAADSTPQVVEQPVASQPAPAAQPAPAIAAEQKTQQATVNPEDELKKLREKRIDAGERASERSKVFQAIAKVERQYPRDYRFPYERAKLAAKGSKASSRTEAFKALSVAAEKAITTGKANEMLSGLEVDKAGDFQKLAQGRQEWSRLLAALKRRDTSLLSRDHTND